MKNYLGVLCLFFLLYGCSMTSKNEADKPLPLNDNNQVVGENEAQPLSGEPHTSNIFVEETEGYQITAYIPETPYEFINKDAKIFIDSTIANIRNGFKNAENIVNKAYFTLEYEQINFLEANKVSIKFTLFSIAPQGQTSTNIFTKVYDTSSQQVLQLKDVFQEDVNFIDEIYNRIIEITKKDNSIPANYEIQLENKLSSFLRFVFTQEGILFYFLPGEIHVEEQGVQAVLLPYEDLVGSLK